MSTVNAPVAVACKLRVCLLQVTSKGQPVKHGRSRVNGQTLITVVVVTKEMLPSFRIVAYYHTSSNEVVSDSVWVDVKDTCMGSFPVLCRKLTESTPKNVFRAPGTSRILVSVHTE